MKGKLRMLWIFPADELEIYVLREGSKRGPIRLWLALGHDEAIRDARAWCRLNATREAPIRLQKFNRDGSIARWEASYFADSRRRKG